MAGTPRELLREILMELNRSAGVYASALVSRDGLLVASVMPEDVDAEAFAAMTATMLGAAETAFSELKRGWLSGLSWRGPVLRSSPWALART